MERVNNDCSINYITVYNMSENSVILIILEYCMHMAVVLMLSYLYICIVKAG